MHLSGRISKPPLKARVVDGRGGSAAPPGDGFVGHGDGAGSHGGERAVVRRRIGLTEVKRERGNLVRALTNDHELLKPRVDGASQRALCIGECVVEQTGEVLRARI